VNGSAEKRCRFFLLCFWHAAICRSWRVDSGYILTFKTALDKHWLLILKNKRFPGSVYEFCSSLVLHFGHVGSACLRAAFSGQPGVKHPFVERSTGSAGL
jgi:hypothetical protein